MTKYYFPTLFIVLIVGIFIGKYFNLSSEPEIDIETRQSGSYQYINPLLECDSSSFINDRNLDQLKYQISDYISKNVSNKTITHASVYYRDLNNGPWLGINEKELFSPASLIKVPLMITYYKLAENDPSILQSTVSIGTNYNYSYQNITPQVTLAANKTYTISELIDRMIIYSDNQAYETLLSQVDKKHLASTYIDLGIDVDNSQADPYGNIISVKSYASFFRILFNSSYLTRSYSEKALQLLSRTAYNQGLTAGLPSTVSVAHKFGERSREATGEKQLHDCGIVYLQKKPYLICVMTRGQDFAKLSSVIKNISHQTYSYLVNH